MFCPECRAEFVEGVKECPECGVALADTLPEAPPLDAMDVVSVLETGDPMRLAAAKAILDDADIPYETEGELLEEYLGAGRLGVGFNPFVGPIQVRVPADREEEALDLLAQLDDDNSAEAETLADAEDFDRDES